MKFWDSKTKHNMKRYVFQCSLATLSIMIILLFLNSFVYTTIIASLGATTFIAFTMPNAYAAKKRNILGGYFLGIIIGIIFNNMSNYILSLNSSLSLHTIYIFTGALSVGVTIFLMTVTNTEHPPSVGMALSLVLSPWNYKTILFVVLSVCLMVITKRLLRKWLIDLN